MNCDNFYLGIQSGPKMMNLPPSNVMSSILISKNTVPAVIKYFLDIKIDEITLQEGVFIIFGTLCSYFVIILLVAYQSPLESLYG